MDITPGMAAYDYGLPQNAIAQEPLEQRPSARLLVSRRVTEIAHRAVADLPELLLPGDLLVINETRVVPARLRLAKATGGVAEVLLLEELGAGCWQALVRPGRRLPPGTVLEHRRVPVLEVGGHVAQGDGRRIVRLVDPEIARAAGELALPPYVKRPLRDPERYQTVFASRPGSVAAPTAGLHLSHELLDQCRKRGVAVATIDLAVGLDTFRPVATDRPEDHQMHSERYSVPGETMEACRRSGRVVAVGTTTVRALEAAAATGRLAGRTDLFIRRPYRFRVVDMLLTNFHLPRSTLLLMLDAFIGPRWRLLYEAALREQYRFLSFGDAMLVAREFANGRGAAEQRVEGGFA